ncbi:hypothetical protein ABK040_013812 [Willaertia magna]
MANNQNSDNKKGLHFDFYTSFSCPYAHRSYICLLECVDKEQFTYHEIDLEKQEQKSEIYLTTINPQGKVPALIVKRSDKEEDNLNVIESLVINDFLQENFRSNLLPICEDKLKQSYLKAQAKIWISYFDNNIGNFLMKIAFEQSKDKLVDESLPLLQNHMFFFTEGKRRVQKFLGEEGPFFFGKRFSLVDIAMFPHIVRIQILLSQLELNLFEVNLKDEVEIQKERCENKIYIEVTDALKEWGAWFKAVKEQKSVQLSSYSPTFVPDNTITAIMKEKGIEYDYDKYVIESINAAKKRFK